MNIFEESSLMKKRIYEASEYLVKCMASLYKAAEDSAQNDMYSQENNLNVSHELLPICTYNEEKNITSIKINNIPPLARKDIKEARLMWVSSIREAIRIMLFNDKNIKKYEKAFVIIKYFVPSNQKLFDNDNMCNKYIIDGIRYAQIIGGDDNFEHLSYAILTVKEDITLPHTEVYILNHSDLSCKVPLLR